MYKTMFIFQNFLQSLLRSPEKKGTFPASKNYSNESNDLRREIQSSIVLPTYKPTTYDEELPGGISSYEWVTSKESWESLRQMSVEFDFNAQIYYFVKYN